MMGDVTEQVVIEKPVTEVFRTLTDPVNLSKLFTDLSKVKSTGGKISGTGQSFSATKTIHGRSQRQIYTVLQFDPPSIYEIETTLFKLPVSYTYNLEEISPGRTRVKLVKTAALRGWTRVFSPLLRHLFSKPEHDMDHLANLARCVEN